MHTFTQAEQHVIDAQGWNADSLVHLLDGYDAAVFRTRLIWFLHVAATENSQTPVFPCLNCGANIVLGRLDDPWIHQDTGNERCAHGDDFAVPAEPGESARIKVFTDPVAGSAFRPDGKPAFTCSFCGNIYATEVTAQDRAAHSCDPLLDCAECGNPMTIDEDEISNHLTPDGDIDYDRDADHVALSGILVEQFSAAPASGYFVTSVDGSFTYAGPFTSTEDADAAAEAIETQNPTITTDITYRAI